MMQPRRQHLIDWEDDDIGYIVNPPYTRTPCACRPSTVIRFEFITRQNFIVDEYIDPEQLFFYYQIKPNCVPCLVRTAANTYFIGEVENYNGFETVFLLHPTIERNDDELLDEPSLTIRRYFDNMVFNANIFPIVDNHYAYACYKLNDNEGILGYYSLTASPQLIYKIVDEIVHHPDDPYEHYIEPPDIHGGRARLRREPKLTAKSQIVSVQQLRQEEEEEEMRANQRRLLRIQDDIIHGRARYRTLFFPLTF